jgi:uncharacterized protein YjbJ (UPF0337 family)
VHLNQLEKTFMKLPWILAIASGAAVAAYIVLNTPGPEYATGNDTLEDAARGTARWGVEKRVSSIGDTISGKVKQTAGKLTGDQDLHDDGVVDQATGFVKDTAGKVAQAAGQAIHDLNR